MSGGLRTLTPFDGLISSMHVHVQVLYGKVCSEPFKVILNAVVTNIPLPMSPGTGAVLNDPQMVKCPYVGSVP